MSHGACGVTGDIEQNMGEGTKRMSGGGVLDDRAVPDRHSISMDAKQSVTLFFFFFLG